MLTPFCAKEQLACSIPLDRLLLNGIPPFLDRHRRRSGSRDRSFGTGVAARHQGAFGPYRKALAHEKLLGKDKGGRFGYRQLLEALAVAILLEKGWNSTAIADLLAGSDDAALARIIEASRSESGSAPGSLPTTLAMSGARRYTREAAEDAAILLAQGILSQSERVLAGRGIVR